MGEGLGRQRLKGLKLNRGLEGLEVENQLAPILSLGSHTVLSPGLQVWPISFSRLHPQSSSVGAAPSQPNRLLPEVGLSTAGALPSQTHLGS